MRAYFVQRDNDVCLILGLSQLRVQVNYGDYEGHVEFTNNGNSRDGKFDINFGYNYFYFNMKYTPMITELETKVVESLKQLKFDDKEEEYKNGNLIVDIDDIVHIIRETVKDTIQNYLYETFGSDTITPVL